MSAARRRFADFVGAGARQEPPAGPVVHGSRAFTAEIGVALEQYRNTHDLARAERFAVRPGLDELLAEAGAGSRDALMREAFRRHGYTLREIGERVGRHPATVWRHIRRADLSSRRESLPSTRSMSPRAKIKI